MLIILLPNICKTQALAARVVGIHLPKPPEIQLSNWAAPKLTKDQKRYAAHDALVGLLIHTALVGNSVRAVPEGASASVPSVLSAEAKIEVELSRLWHGSLAAPKQPAPPQSSMRNNTATRLWRLAAQAASAACGAAPPPSSQADTEMENAPTETVCSPPRVMLDILHLLKRYEDGLSGKTDPLFGLFMHKMMNAVFVNDAKDVAYLTKWLQETRDMSLEEIGKLPAKYFARRVQRHVPAPLELAARMQRVVEEFQDADTEKGRRFYRADEPGKPGLLSIHRQQLTHVLRGCVSDPEGMSMYIDKRQKDGDALSYKSKRGSSQLEARPQGIGLT